jgi:hypothetical protein
LINAENHNSGNPLRPIAGAGNAFLIKPVQKAFTTNRAGGKDENVSQDAEGQ